MTETRPMIRQDALVALPKPEVHVHLEGCFDPATLEQWAIEARAPMPRPRDRLFQFDGLTDFLHFLDWACGLANSQERLSQMAYDFLPQTASRRYRLRGCRVRTRSVTSVRRRQPGDRDAVRLALALV
jgi:adenosine deaminase